MPPHSRSQRRRQGARQQERPARPSSSAASASATGQAAATGQTISLDEAPAARPQRQARRVLSRSAPEPVDYTKDYMAVRSDLRWIAIWSLLLFAAMAALKFSGVV